MKDESTFNNGNGQNNTRVKHLLAGYLRQSLSNKEVEELDAWISASDENRVFFNELINKDNVEVSINKLRNIDTGKALIRIEEQLNLKKSISSKRTRRIWSYSIAASILLIAGLFFYIKSGQKDKPNEEIVNTKPDLKPGGYKATLTLADGTLIDLGKQNTGLIEDEDGSLINKVAEGKLAYTVTNTLTNVVKYNLLSTPRGGQYRIVLSDSTVVWLNAASSLRYPVSFPGSERVVELTGEGYFEVAKKEKQPFKVKLKNNVEVAVLGTHFNINAYDDEEYIRTTLLEGSVDISSSKMKSKILPGQQMAIQSNGDIALSKDELPEEVTGWKEGEFYFRDTPLESVMRQVGRWYDVDVEYQYRGSAKFTATFKRSESISALLKILEKTGGAHFTIEGKKIIVKP